MMLELALSRKKVLNNLRRDICGSFFNMFTNVGKTVEDNLYGGFIKLLDLLWSIELRKQFEREANK